MLGRTSCKILNAYPIVPLGQHCMLAHNLTSCGLGAVNFGFEWIVMEDLSSVIKILDTQFQSCFDLENCHYDPDLDCVTDSFLHIRSLHDFKKNSEFQVDHAEVRSKYLKRLSRLESLLKGGNHVVFIRFSRFVNRDLTEFSALAQRFQSQYPQVNGRYFIIYNGENELPQVSIDNIHCVTYKRSLTYKIIIKICRYFWPNYVLKHFWKGDSRQWCEAFKHIDNVLYKKFKNHKK